MGVGLETVFTIIRVISSTLFSSSCSNTVDDSSINAVTLYSPSVKSKAKTRSPELPCLKFKNGAISEATFSFVELSETTNLTLNGPELSEPRFSMPTETFTPFCTLT